MYQGGPHPPNQSHQQQQYTPHQRQQQDQYQHHLAQQHPQYRQPAGSVSPHSYTLQHPQAQSHGRPNQQQQLHAYQQHTQRRPHNQYQQHNPTQYSPRQPYATLAKVPYGSPSCWRTLWSRLHVKYVQLRVRLRTAYSSQNHGHGHTQANSINYSGSYGSKFVSVLHLIIAVFFLFLISKLLTTEPQQLNDLPSRQEQLPILQLLGLTRNKSASNGSSEVHNGTNDWTATTGDEPAGKSSISGSGSEELHPLGLGASATSGGMQPPAAAASLSGSTVAPGEELDPKWPGQLGDDILFGVLCAPSLLATRGASVGRTWGSHVKHILFYVGNGMDWESLQSEHVNPMKLPLVRLEDADDKYPPQDKELLMLEHMALHYRDRFRWYVKADDDTFIRPRKLINFLQRFEEGGEGNPMRPLYIGRPGWGKKEEQHQLGLEFHGQARAYCMGGPGYALSAPIMKIVGTKWRGCLADSRSNHSDTEVGRCILKNAGTECLASDRKQLESAFIQSYMESKDSKSGKAQATSFDVKLTDNMLAHAISFHPLKKPEEMKELYERLYQTDYG